MSVTDFLSYLSYRNPISQAVITSAASVAKSTGIIKKSPQTIVMDPLWKLAGSNYHYVRVAGAFGAAAVMMGAYGKNCSDIKDKAVFETANRYHFLHSLALLAVSLTRRPKLTGSLMALGTILFSGTGYYRAISGDRRTISIAACGGYILVAAWISLIF